MVQKYLQKHAWDIDVIFAYNDDMALGAEKALETVLKGKINCVVECSPLLGPQFMKVITDLKSSKELPLRIITNEKVFTMENTRQEIGWRSY